MDLWNTLLQNVNINLYSRRETQNIIEKQSIGLSCEFCSGSDSSAVWFCSACCFNVDIFCSVSSLQLTIDYSLDVPGQEAAADKAMLPEREEYAEIEQFKLETLETLSLEVCIGFRL